MPSGNEYLLNNAVGEDLQRALRPFDLVRELLLVSKYRIKYNFITPRSRKYHILSLGLLLVFLYGYKDVSECEANKGCSMMSYVIHPVIYATITATAAYHSTPAVKLVTKMQGINKKLRVAGVSNFLHHFRRNWYYVVCVHLIYGLKTVLVITKLNVLNIYTRFLSSVILDLEILSATFIVEFLFSRMDSWIFLLGNSNKRLVADRDTHTSAPLIFGIIKDILKAFRIHRTLCQSVILIHSVLTFIQCLFGVGMLITISKSQIPIYPSVLTIVIFILNLTPLISLIMLSITCERFDSGVERVQKACLEILDDPNYTQKSTRRLAKNVLRLCRARYRKMRPCGLFAVDAALPLRLLGLITTYCVVLLQFAFL